ncbi:MAG TPA: PVC-type heme-binding CxxCH protein [Pirellulales bacterium]|nr:PVC-type heme-binding CxxCH protein [Pirellulales bacterium]
MQKSRMIGSILLAAAQLLGGGATCCAEDAPQTARSPQQEQATFVLADANLAIDLVAAEPDVTSPVAMCWDADGAMYVAEMRDYPVGPASGTIRKLVDADGDGHYERATLFADKLNFPNGVLATGEGLLVTAAPDFLLLRDTDHDGVADERRVVFTGFGEGNQQLRANGLCWGLDNWIYGANGRSDGVVRRPDEPADRGVSIRTRDFRFSRDFKRFEAVMGQSQFGQTHDDAGRRFLSWNTIPIRQVMFSEADVSRNPYLAAAAVHNLADPSDLGEVFPISPRPQTFNRESTNHYNAMAGLGIFRGDALGDEYAGDAFVGESLSSLVHRRKLAPVGPTFVSHRVEQGKEFLAARDSWFHPVFACTGPDGALYIADFYRRWVEHPQFVTGEWRNKVDWREGVAHGRIWRVHRRDRARQTAPNLARAGTAELVAELASTNGWRRDTAQRLLVERGDRSVASQLLKLARGDNARAALHALSTLDGIGALDDAAVLASFAHPAADVRRQAVLLAALRWRNAQALRQAACRLAETEKDAGVLFELARAVGDLPAEEKLPALVALARVKDAPWIVRALSASAADVAGPFIARLAAENSSWLGDPSIEQVETLEYLGECWAVVPNESDAGSCMDFLASDRAEKNLSGRLAVLAGATRAWHHTAATGKASPADPSRDPRLVPTIDAALGQAFAEAARTDLRSLAVRVVGDVGSSEQVARLAPLAAGSATGPAADTAVASICRRGDGALVRELIDGWASFTPARRRLIASSALESTVASREFVDAIAREVVRAAEIDPAVRAAFEKSRDAEIAAQAAELFARSAPAPRDEVLARYRPALELAGNREHGAKLFKEHCATCHTILGFGRQVGPDISGVAGRPKETLLGDLLDPSRQVAPDFLSYSLITRDGRALAGILVSDTGEAVTLRRGEGADDVVLRADIEELQASGKSLMPEGLEQRLTSQDVADVLSFLTLPERRLLEQP